jgi:hypothetical protein
MKDPDYTDRPTRVRIFTEEWSEGASFSIDGADNEGRYTEGVWSRYPTLEAALADVEDFVEKTTLDGVAWSWDTARPKHARIINPPKETTP